MYIHTYIHNDNWQYFLYILPLGFSRHHGLANANDHSNEWPPKFYPPQRPYLNGIWWFLKMGNPKNRWLITISD